MKDAEDEAFDELAKRQGAWGGGFKAKQAMAADKLQEPVARVTGVYGGRFTYAPLNPAMVLPIGMALYAWPQRPWVGLTDEEIDALHTSIKVRLMGTFDTKDIYRAVEQALEEKNT